MKKLSLSWSLLQGFRCINQKIPIYLFGILIVFLWSNSLAAQPPNLTKLLASDGAAVDRFGYSVSISGDQLVVGAYEDDDNGTNSGSAYVYEKVGGVWTNEQKLTASDGADYWGFGVSVSVSGDYMVVGATAAFGGGFNPGSAYVYEKVGGVWTNEQKLTASDGAAGDQFGRSVSISGDQLVVGTSSGSVYVYQKDVNGNWGAEQKLTAKSGRPARLWAGMLNEPGC